MRPRRWPCTRTKYRARREPRSGPFLPLPALTIGKELGALATISGFESSVRGLVNMALIICGEGRTYSGSSFERFQTQAWTSSGATNLGQGHIGRLTNVSVLVRGRPPERRAQRSRGGMCAGGQSNRARAHGHADSDEPVPEWTISVFSAASSTPSSHCIASSNPSSSSCGCCCAPMFCCLSALCVSRAASDRSGACMPLPHSSSSACALQYHSRCNAAITRTAV